MNSIKCTSISDQKKKIKLLRYVGRTQQAVLKANKFGLGSFGNLTFERLNRKDCTKSQHSETEALLTQEYVLLSDTYLLSPIHLTEGDKHQDHLYTLPRKVISTPQ